MSLCGSDINWSWKYLNLSAVIRMSAHQLLMCRTGHTLAESYGKEYTGRVCTLMITGHHSQPLFGI